MAVTIFNDMTGGWDETCRGGLYWQKNHEDSNGISPYKNAIANELFLAVAAGLYVRLLKTQPHWVYFQGTDNKLWLVLDDGSQQSQIGNNTTASTPFVTPDGFVYFQGTDNKLWRVHYSGSQQSQIGGNTTASTPFVTPDGFVYFQGTDNKLWRVHYSGNQQSQIGGNTTASTPFVTPDGFVYFQGTDNKLWKVHYSGSQQSQIGGNTTASTPFVTPDGFVYFQGTDNKLWRVHYSGNQQSQIGGNTTASTPFVTPDGFVYFQGTDDKLWRIHYSGNQQSQIGGNTTASTPSVTPDGWVYFQGTDNKLWKVRNDGSQQSQIGGNTTKSKPFISSAGPPAFANFKSWALREWEWFSDSELINSHNLINDSLTTSAKPPPCRNDLSTDIWTYNQGVILGALCDLSEITGDPSYLTKAEKIADALIKNQVKPPESGVDPNNILREYDDGSPDESIDHVQFKGIFVRNLGYLCTKTHNSRYSAFLRRNAASALKYMDRSTNQFGSCWDANVDKAELHPANFGGRSAQCRFGSADLCSGPFLP